MSAASSWASVACCGIAVSWADPAVGIEQPAHGRPGCQTSAASGPPEPSSPGTAGAVAADTQTAALTAWPGESDWSTITTHFSFAAPVRSPVLISSGAYPCAA